VTINVTVKVLDSLETKQNVDVVVMDCTCKGEPLLLTEENMGWFKKQWQKFIDWIFEGFYK
jgi:hypothetical protein